MYGAAKCRAARHRLGEHCLRLTMVRKRLLGKVTMAQFDMIGSPSGPDPKRLLLAVVASSFVLMTYSYFFAPVPVSSQVAKKQEEQVKKPAPEAVPTQNLGHLG